MNLKKWQTNCPSLKKKFDCQSTVKVLGLNWDALNDELHIPIESVIQNCSGIPMTRRGILKSVASIFDPLGILVPFTVRAKILLQQIWKNNLDWDDVLPRDLINTWSKWYEELKLLQNFRIPRSVVKDRTISLELHIFADASCSAYTTVAYVRFINDCQIKSQFLMAKNRVTPSNKKGEKSLTLPKLELTAALCASRLMHYLLHNVDANFKRIVLWSDSKIALFWIDGANVKGQPYVTNRVKEIRRLSAGLWRHCPGHCNPADLLTRGLKSKNLMESELRAFGPAWLKHNEDCWPENEDSTDTLADVSAFAVPAAENLPVAEPIFRPDRFSSLEKVLRITAYVIRFVDNARNVDNKKSSSLEVAELQRAEIYWIKFFQGEAFPNEIPALKESKPISRCSAILTLEPFLDQDFLLRLGGRLHESALPYSTRHPLILPRKSWITESLIWDAHEKVFHSGINSALNYLCRRFWILKGSQQIKKVISRCDRLEAAKTFEVVGVDFAGPSYVNQPDNTVSKVYIMLFTCAVVRAIHLELVPTMSTEDSIKALRRFIARRGIPSIIYSDNAKTFKRTSQELAQLMKVVTESEFQEHCRSMRIKWRFIVERVAWWGGFWERLVKSVKDGLKFALGKRSVNFHELFTILAGIGAAVNSRPLTYLDDDPESLLILSPAHFLLGGTSQVLELPTTTQSDDREILRMWKLHQKLVGKFWTKWKEEYLQQLRSIHHTSLGRRSNFKIDDVVLVHEDNVPRLLWKLARIVRVFPGRDGKIIACEIRFANNLVTRRPVQLLYPLELPRHREDVENVRSAELPKTDRSKCCASGGRMETSNETDSMLTYADTR